MEKEERINLYKTAIATWGEYPQLNMLHEEMGELLTAIARYQRGRGSEEDIITELADVSIMIEQMGVMFGYDKYEDEKERKLIRLRDDKLKDAKKPQD